MKILIILILVYLSKQNSECGTSVECYVKAIDLLNKARQEYYDGRDRLYNITQELRGYLDSQINSDRMRMTNIENSISQQNAKIVELSDSTNTRLVGLDWKIHNHNCREVYTGCNSDGQGNLIFLDRHYSHCEVNEFMKAWTLQRCDSTTIRIFYICSSLP
jgi:hypothetical protein